MIPTRRSTAEAVQILVSHAFGDAGSPYLIGAVSVAIPTVTYILSVVVIFCVARGIGLSFLAVIRGIFCGAVLLFVLLLHWYGHVLRREDGHVLVGH